MSQLCHSCGIWWANSTSLSAVPAYASASTKADRGEVSLPLRCSLLHMLTSDIVPRKLENTTSSISHPNAFCVRLMGPTRLLRFLLPLFSPAVIFACWSLVARARATSQVINVPSTLSSVPPSMNTVLCGWLNNLFLRAGP